MTKQHLSVFLIVMTVVFGLLAGDVLAAGLDVYINNGNPASKNAIPPEGGGNSWTKVPDGQSVSVAPNGSITIACRNSLAEFNRKWFYILLNGNGVNNLNVVSEGFKGDDASDKAEVKRPGLAYTNTAMMVGFLFDPQPAWERLKITNTGPNNVSFTIKTWSKCGTTYRNARSYDTYASYFNAPGAVSGQTDITEVCIFPRDVAVDVNLAASFVAYNGTPWDYQWVYVDPEGNPRPLGGVRFYTLGVGLETAELYDASFPLQEGIESVFDLYAYDAAENRYMHFYEDISHYTPLPDPTWGDGDVNLDNLVDYMDLMIAWNNFGDDNTVWESGDMDGDGDVDNDDIDIIFQNMGRDYTL